MPNESCVHYTGKKLCMNGNVCEGDMPCYERYIAKRNQSNPDKKFCVNNKIKCPYCGEWFFWATQRIKVLLQILCYEKTAGVGKVLELTDYQNELAAEGWGVMQQHNFLYLALETRVGKTPISLTIAGRLNLPILFLTKASNIKDIEHTVSMMAIPNVTVMSFDSLHKCTKQRQVIIADEAHSSGHHRNSMLYIFDV